MAAYPSAQVPLSANIALASAVVACALLIAAMLIVIMSNLYGFFFVGP